jgi:hypothetical protein
LLGLHVGRFLDKSIWSPCFRSTWVCTYISYPIVLSSLFRVNSWRIACVYSGVQCYDKRKTFSPKISAKKVRFWLKLLLFGLAKMIITWILKKDANFRRRKLAKISKNVDHNIDPTLHLAPTSLRLAVI